MARVVHPTEGTVEQVGRLARAGLDHGDLQRRADAVLRAAVGFDGAVWATVDPASLLLTGCQSVGFHPFGLEHRSLVHDRENRSRDRLTLRRLLARRPPVGVLSQGPGEPDDDLRRRELLAPYGIADELVAALVVGGHCWGAVRVFRRGPLARPFTSNDVDQFTAASAPLAEGLRLAFLRAATAAPDGIADPPGVVTLDASGNIATQTQHATRWLDGLTNKGLEVMASLAARIATHDHASAVVAGEHGPVALHASRLRPNDDRIAIVVERPRPLELTPRVMHAYDLTPRESQVTELVLRGRTTTQIASSLGLSRYTVQDHLKSIFAKVGVQTRGELANEIHVRFYLPLADSNRTPGPYGYFLSA